MSTISRKGRTAETFWKVKKRCEGVTFLELNLKTGRTHQIRVHCAAMNHPIIGDPVYFNRKVRREFWANRNLTPLIQSIPRQMLHAWRIEFVHPVNNRSVFFEAPIPEDMQNLIKSTGCD